MEWLKDYWWLILVFLLGVILNAIRDLNKLSFKQYIDKKKGIKPIPYEDDKDDEDNWKK